MKHTQSKLNQDAQTQSAAQKSQEEQTEFATPEELLRFDAGQTEVPPAVAVRLQQSISNEPPPAKSWWRRVFKP